MEQYNLRKQAEGLKDLIDNLQNAPSRLYDIKDDRYNIDNCACPECPCADSDLPKVIRVAGAAVLAASTSVLVATAPLK